MPIGKGMRSQSSSIADSLNEGPRAPRRSSKSFDLDADQNRRARAEESRTTPVPEQRHTGEPRRAPRANDGEAGFGDALLNSSVSDADGGGTRGKMIGIYHPRPGGGDVSDSEIDDEAWLAEQLAARLPAIINPEDEPLVPAKTANAGPIGLLGFGMTTVLLNLHNTGHWPLYSAIPAMGICFGGGAQFIAGILEFTKGNTFGCVAFCSYGAFWGSLVCIWMLRTGAVQPGNPVNATSAYFLGVYLIVWGIYSFLMFLCTARMNLVIFLLFFTLAILFFLLGGANMAGNATAVKAAGYEGILCGAIALYLAFAEVLNEVWDRTILPVVPMTQLLDWFGRGKNKKESQSSPAAQDSVAA